MKHQVAPRSAALPLFLLSLAIGVSCVVRGGFGIVQEAARVDLGIDDLRLGLVQGLAMSIPIAVLSIPLGRIVDRASRVKMVVWMAAICSLGALGTALAQSFTVLFVARMAAGLGSVCALPAAISLLADLYRPEQRGRAMLALTIGQWAGIAGAFAIGGALFGHFNSSTGLLGLAPWRSVQLVIGIGSALLVLPLLLLREPARHELGAGKDAPFGVVVRELIARRRFLAPLFVGQIAVVMADAAAGIWIAPVLTRSYHQTPQQFGNWIGLVIFVSGVGGSILGGLLADFGLKRGGSRGLLSGAVVASIFAIPAALFPVMPSVTSFALALAVLLTSGTLMGLITATAIAVLVPNELRGVCLGAFVAIAGMIGFGLAPTLVTGIAALLGGGASLARALAIVGVATGIVSAVAFWIARRDAPVAEAI